MSVPLRIPLCLRLIALPILFAFAPAQAQVASNAGIAPVPLIKYIKSKPDVWFATLEQTASYVKQQQGKAN